MHLFIGDVHGLDSIDILEEGLKNSDHIVMLGDYVDSFFVPASEQLYNLNDLCNFVREHKDKITLLTGNHDFSYIHSINSISGKQYMHAHEYKKIFEDNIDLFQIAWGYTNPDTMKYTLATHAGLTKGYWKKYVVPEFKPGKFLHTTTGSKNQGALKIHEILNLLKDKEDILWKVGYARGGMSDPGPLWADYTEVLDDPYDGINQVFGHTPFRPTLDYFGEYFIACIDSAGNRKIESMAITL